MAMRPFVLIILDGWGYSKQKLGNAILSASTPTIDFIQKHYPALLLQAAGKSVGLEWGESGNSEVGHLTIGAGRTVFQYSTRINRAIESGDFFKNPALLNAVDHAKKNKSRLHLVGLLGSGTVHSSFTHLAALLNLAKAQGAPPVYLHLFSDGKDSGLKEAPDIIRKLEAEINTAGIGAIATIVGRHYAMDRDTNWDRTQSTYNLLTQGEGEKAENLIDTINAHYQEGLDDTFLPPMVKDSTGIIRPRDAVIFFNFREDSMRQIARAFTEQDFKDFPRTAVEDLFVVFMTQYITDQNAVFQVAFPPPEIDNGLAEILSKLGKKQLHIAETVKYAHTTYFFNCLRNAPYEGEVDILVKSDKQPHDRPEMKAAEIAQHCIDELSKDMYDFTVINFANADIISHTGELEAATKGVEHIDIALGKIYNAIVEKDGIMIITADHGNAESLIYKASGEAETKHNLNPVPFYLAAREYQRQRTDEEINQALSDTKGLISDVAPTILKLMQVSIPEEMTGTSLLPLVSR